MHNIMCVYIEILKRECDDRKQGGSYKNGPTKHSLEKRFSGVLSRTVEFSTMPKRFYKGKCLA